MSPLLLIPKIVSYASGVGLVGLALYQALTQHDAAAAGDSLVKAAVSLGLGQFLHTSAPAK